MAGTSLAGWLLLAIYLPTIHGLRLAQMGTMSPNGGDDGVDFRPAYHITPPSNWMNDPNGLMERDGIFHVFFQFNPSAPIWGAPHWGHVASRDLAHWQRLPVALSPEETYDIDGVFSGSATVLPDGDPVIMYTGTSRRQELGFFWQVQALARPENGSDPLLQRWVKDPRNPVIEDAPPRGTNFQFRDPQTAWRQEVGEELGSLWLTTIGSQVSCVGAAPMYASRDFVKWEFFGYLHSQPGVVPSENETECTFGETQFGAEGRNWEVVCYFPKRVGEEVIHIFKYSDQIRGRTPFGRDWYVLSDVPLAFTNKTVPGQGNALTPSLRGAPFAPAIIDHGDIYASKFFNTSSGRLLWMGWSFETSTGCTGTCSDGTPLTDARGWQGLQTIPREVQVDLETGQLLMTPIGEVEALRSAQLFEQGGMKLVPGARRALPLKFPKGGSGGRQMDVSATFKLSDEASAEVSSTGFKVGVAVTHGRTGALTSVFLNGSLSAGGGGVEELEMWVDRSATGGATSANLQGGRVTLGGVAKEVTLRLLVDRSVVEAVGQGGRVRATSRVYPAGRGDWGLELFNEGAAGSVVAGVEAWEMEGAFVDDLW
ncbi:unnamed protein product [Ostreobium quekettii]|uniref:Uncharacterized protein n=1 Tax=Ostreobium quekettii TaxID=121088 RepID=A0A8S1J9A9_9CHLO|nr:unnamed protein product [Ostreobium quekettii]|eukprot:evm.model.scf_92.8 EVM.evm.TU.scf_92.8   scf_92:100638-104609(+)